MLRRIDPREAHKKRRAFRHTVEDAQIFDAVVESGVIEGFAPSAPLISRETAILTFGSCFAGNIAKVLAARAYNVKVVGSIDRLFTPIALKSFFESMGSDAAGIEEFEKNWGISASKFTEIKGLVTRPGVIIITYGLSLSWIDRSTGADIFDPGRKEGTKLIISEPERFYMRQMSVEEVVDAMSAVVASIRKLNPVSPIIFTLSPIPLVRAVCDTPVVASDCVSKATLRAAIHELMMLRLHSVYYYPAFEILKWLAPMVDTIWGADNMIHHIRKEWIDFTINKFIQNYCIEKADPQVPVTAKYYAGDIKA